MEKTIEEVAYNLYPVYRAIANGRNIDTNEDRRRTFMAGAAEQRKIDEEGIAKAYNAGYAKAIDNVCEWLECNTDKYHWVNWIQEEWGDDVYKLIRDLKKAMEQ